MITQFLLKNKKIPFVQYVSGIVLMAWVLVVSPAFSAAYAGEGNNQGNRFSYADIAMGTIVRLTLVHDDEREADNAAKLAFSTIRDWQQDVDHRFLEGSVGRVNEAAGSMPVTVSDRAARLLERALDFCLRSGGVFDISIGAISIRPEYFRDEPDPEQRRLVDFTKIEFNSEANSVFLPEKGMALDLGGLAKGSIIDAAVSTLKKQGIRSGIVEGGGDFYCFGPGTWRCGLQHPRKDELLGVIEVQNRAICGSGDYHQFVITEEGGKRQRRHHILNPATGDSARKSISVTTVASTTELADALATTLLIMGPEEGRGFLDRNYPDAAALWVLPDLSIEKTANFPPIRRPAR